MNSNILKIIFVGALFLMLGLVLQAGESGYDYFKGKWNVLLEGTPSGDAKMLMDINKVDGEIVATVIPEGQEETEEVTRVEIEEDNITVYWVSSGYDVYLFMEKIDANEIEGTLMDMFDAYGERIK